MREAVAFDPDAAVAFVARHFGPPSVMAFANGRCIHPTLPTTDMAREFIAAHPDADLYFALADRKDAKAGKLAKGDCLGARWAWVDLDPPKDVRGDEGLRAWQAETLARLDASDIPAPPVVINSGRGLWALWPLTRRVPLDEAEAINYALAQAFGADHCHNIDRVARVPFTRNGKTGAIAFVVRDDPGAIPPEHLPKAAPPGAGEGSNQIPPPTISARLASVDDLDRWNVPGRVKVIVNVGHHPDEPKEGDNSRSAWLFDAVCQLVRCEVPDDVIMAVLTDGTFGISSSILDKDTNGERYAARQIERARSTIAAQAAEFQVNEKNVPYSNQHNIRVALTRLGVTVSYDEFQDRLLIAGLPDTGDLLSDAAMTRLWLLTDERFGFRPAKEFFWDVVADAARRNTFHPVRDYLDGLAWDATPRIDTWLTAYGGAEDTPYTRAVGALMLVAAVRRVRQPGCKFDEMVVLESEQGKEKSSALALLAVRDEWFTDDMPLNADSKVVIERLAGRWIVEAGELKGMRKGDVEGLKAFLSRRVDRARAAYARLTQEVPRQCILVGTTNSQRYLKDGTGNRRFWPVAVGVFDLEGLRRDRDQLWAEAAAREASGVSIRLDRELWADAAEEQEARRIEDPFVVTLGNVFGNLAGKVRAADAWALLGIPTGQQTQDQNARFGEAMRELGWERTKLRFGSRGPEWAYAKGDAAERQRHIEFVRDGDGKSSVVPF
jgi:hypothetical protein